MLASRRQILKSAIALPFVSGTRGATILTEDHSLSDESARGFRKVVCSRQNTIIFAAARNLSEERASELKRQVMGGAWLLFESAPSYSVRQGQLLASEFQLRVSAPIEVGGYEWAGNYVEYGQAIKRLVRPFTAVIPVHSPTAKPLAQTNGITVAVKQPLGRGNLIFLGSLLGPSLFAEEREAHDVAAALLGQF